MLIAILIIAACGCVVLASVFMWWATKRNAVWAMAAGVLLGLVVVAAAVLIAWLLTRNYWEGLDQIHSP